MHKAAPPLMNILPLRDGPVIDIWDCASKYKSYSQNHSSISIHFVNFVKLSLLLFFHPFFFFFFVGFISNNVCLCDNGLRLVI